MSETKEKSKDVTPVEVVAIERGHDGNTVRNEGERFFVPKWRLEDGSSWFVAVKDAAEVVAEAESKRSRVPPGAGRS